MIVSFFLQIGKLVSIQTCRSHNDIKSPKENWGQAGLDEAFTAVTLSVPSKNGVLIRLTDERWAHIAEEHCELAGYRDLVLETVQAPQRVLAGHAGELLAVREFETGKFLVVVYREGDSDGFIITAFWTRRWATLNRRKQLWP